MLAAREAIARGYDDVLVMFGDTPLIDPAALIAARDKLAEGAAVAVLGLSHAEPDRLRPADRKGRRSSLAIREEKDCSEEERKIDFCNGGLMAIDGKLALSLLDAVGNANAKGEYYLTDIVEIADERGLKVVATEATLRERARHQQPRRTRRGRGDLAEAQAPRDDAFRRHADRAGNGFFLARHRDRRRTPWSSPTSSSRRA